MTDMDKIDQAWEALLQVDHGKIKEDGNVYVRRSAAERMANGLGEFELRPIAKDEVNLYDFRSMWIPKKK